MRNVRARALLAAALIGMLLLAGCGSGNATKAGDDGGMCGASRFAGGVVEEVVTIGDSYMNLLLRGLEKSLREVSGHSYRNHGVPGAFLLNGDIPNQYAAAVLADPVIETVVMTGGGNDVLASDCTGTCQGLVDQVSERIAELKQRMADDGVKDVIIVGYGYPADEARHAALDYFRSQLARWCREDAAPRCNYVDPVKELEGKIGSDGVHPTAEGFDTLARMVWDLMQAKDMRR